jgi:hypothetical protein
MTAHRNTGRIASIGRDVRAGGRENLAARKAWCPGSRSRKESACEDSHWTGGITPLGAVSLTATESGAGGVNASAPTGRSELRGYQEASTSIAMPAPVDQVTGLRA